MSRAVIAHQVQLEIRGDVTCELLRSESIMSGSLIRIAYARSCPENTNFLSVNRQNLLHASAFIRHAPRLSFGLNSTSA